MNSEVAELVQAFEDRTLPKSRWTHEAHVTVCWATLRRLDADAALAHLRGAIRTYNESTDTPNTDTDGYHETITRYYVTAVAELADRPIDEVLAHPTCSRAAPLELWPREVLFSTEARRRWIPPRVDRVAG